jgi:hypothetical protein
MAGLVPAIHVFDFKWAQDVDARNTCGHDELEHFPHKWDPAVRMKMRHTKDLERPT